MVLVVGRAADEVRAAVAAEPDGRLRGAAERLGTGHAVLQARAACRDGAGVILVLPGDMPLLSETTLERLVDHHRATGAAATLLTAVRRRPAGLRPRACAKAGGRSASSSTATPPPPQRQIREISTSVYCFDAATLLARARPGDAADNEQGEYYLTDVIGHPRARRRARRGGDRRRPARVPRVSTTASSSPQLAADPAPPDPRPADGRGRHRARSRHHLRGRHGDDRRRHRALSRA